MYDLLHIHATHVQIKWRSTAGFSGSLGSSSLSKSMEAWKAFNWWKTGVERVATQAWANATTGPTPMNPAGMEWRDSWNYYKMFVHRSFT